MRLSCVLIAGIALAGAGAARGAVLNAPHTLHHSRTQHLVQSHHHAVHAVAHSSARTSTAARTTGAVRTTRTHARHHASGLGNGAATIRRASLRGRRHHYYERFTASSFATSDEFAGDVTTGEDPTVRQAAIDALGDMNGTAVVIDPSNGRILAMVNQKLALSPGAEPCSTIKLTVALAALSEGIVTRDTPVQLPGFRMNMTQALAHSNNLYFEEMGRELGFQRVRH